MVDATKKFVQQVELNTIASSMGMFSDGMKKFYSHFSNKYPELYSGINAENVPSNKAITLDSISNSMIEAIKLFSPENYNETIIVFVINENESNDYDIRKIEDKLWEKQ